MTGMHSDKHVIWQFHSCVNILVYLDKPSWYNLLHTYAIWYIPLLQGYKPVLHVTVQNNTRLNQAQEKIRCMRLLQATQQTFFDK